MFPRLARTISQLALRTDSTPHDEGWRTMGEFLDADLFLAGFPKSGNTWVQAIAASIMFGFDLSRTPDNLVQDLVPDVHYRKRFKRYLHFGVFKTHHLPRPEYRRVVHIVRDGRDALCSYVHHLKALGRPHDFSNVIDGEVWPSRWEEHARAWEENPYDAEITTIRYEDLIAEPLKPIRQLAEQLGRDLDDDALRRVAEATHFAAMSRREGKLGWDNRQWPADAKFVRRGKVGSFRDEMPADALAAFELRAGEMLTRHGYALADARASDLE